MADKYVEVRNLTNYPVVYLIEEDNLRRAFGGGESKKILESELRKLYYQPGGEVLVKEFLSIGDKELAAEFGVTEDSFDHEYTWTAADVDKVLYAIGTDALADALDFAPEGIIDLIVERALAIKVPDVNKRQLIQEKTGKDISRMIEVQEQLKQELGNNEEEEAPKRRRVTAANTEEAAPQGRRVQE